jgi:hypothetical protein
MVKPLHFIEEPIEVYFDKPPLLEKKPGCPNAINWREEMFRIIDLLNEWTDYRRRGRMARNMQPAHSATASQRGSWGVGCYYFRVLTVSSSSHERRIFEIYYDRAPKNVDQRKGSWFLYRELEVPEA